MVTIINKIIILLSIFFIGCSDINLFQKDKNNIVLNVKAVERYTDNPRTKDSIEVRIVKKPLLRRWQKIFLLRQQVDSLGMISFIAKKNASYVIWAFGENEAFGFIEFDAKSYNNKDTLLIQVRP